jgi:hypothetical protein
MSRHQPHGKQLPETTGAQHEILERTTLVEETAFMSSDPSPPGAPSAVVTLDNSGLAGYAVGTDKPRPSVTHHRPQGDLSDAQFRLLQNLERLTYSLQGPEESLDDTYSRPFLPQTINRA